MLKKEKHYLFLWANIFNIFNKLTKMEVVATQEDYSLLIPYTPLIHSLRIEPSACIWIDFIIVFDGVKVYL